MDKEFLQELLTQMVHQNKASWLLPTTKSSALIYWRKPEEWAQIIYKFVERIGGIGSIYTVYDLIEGDDSSKEGNDCVIVYTLSFTLFLLISEFHGLPDNLVKIIIEELEKNGKARLFSDDSSTSFKESGLKFY